MRSSFLSCSLAACALIFFGLAGCDSGSEEPTPRKNILHRIDGRSVQLGGPSGLAVDVNEDRVVDFNLFVELTANSAGDHLYAGINPIGANAVLAGPSLDEHFLNMGFATSLAPAARIPENPASPWGWSPDFHALAIRHTPTSGPVWYEGDWKAGEPTYLPIRLSTNGTEKWYGWLLLTFNPQTEVVTLTEYAFNTTAGETLAAGER